MVARTQERRKWRVPQGFFVVFLVLFLVLAGQLFYLATFTTIYNTNMDEFAAGRTTVKTPLNASRGTIYDYSGNVLAQNVSTYTVIAYLDSSRTTNEDKPRHVVDPEATAEALAPILNMSVSYLEGLLTRKVYQVELGPGGRNISELVKEEIEALELPGIGFTETISRNYPNGAFASYIIGYAKKYTIEEEIMDTTISKEELTGELGIEAKFNNELAGQDGYLIYQKDKYGYQIYDTPETRIDAVDGDDIYLTIDSAIQRFVEAAMSELESTYNPEWASITVMNAKTGAILASGTIPNYDPNTLNITNYESPLVTYIYEPGSTMKIYTYMCAIDKGTYDGNATYKSGSIKIGDSTIYDWKNEGWGYLTYDTGFAYSSNVAVSNIVQNYLTKGELYDCFTKYGFGKTTGIALSREMSGTLSFNYPIEVATAGFGQGITTTAIQNLQALTIIANDGVMVTPYIVSKIVDPNTQETVFEATVQKSEQLVKTSTVTKMKELMNSVINNTDNYATGHYYALDDVTLIGKTGTAQVYDTKTNTYTDGNNDYIYSFAGMFPADDPEVIIYAVMKKPSWNKQFGMVAAVRSIVESIVKYYNIGNETTTSTNTTLTLDSYLNKDVKTVIATLNDYGINAIQLGDGNKIIAMSPSANTKVVTGDKVFLVTNSTSYTMPNLKGWSRSDIEKLSELLNFKVNFNGYGYATSQSIKAGEVINSDQTLEITLKSKYNLDE